MENQRTLNKTNVIEGRDDNTMYAEVVGGIKY